MRHLDESTIIETESRMSVAGTGRWGWAFLFIGCRISVLQDKTFWRWRVVMVVQPHDCAACP